jgi:hypothetical protein
VGLWAIIRVLLAEHWTAVFGVGAETEGDQF